MLTAKQTCIKQTKLSSRSNMKLRRLNTERERGGTNVDKVARETWTLVDASPTPRPPPPEKIGCVPGCVIFWDWRLGLTLPPPPPPPKRLAACQDALFSGTTTCPPQRQAGVINFLLCSLLPAWLPAWVALSLQLCCAPGYPWTCRTP